MTKPENTCSMANRPTIMDRLFPVRYLEPPEEREGFAPGDLSITTVVHLDWLDRLRIFLSGNLALKTRTQTDVEIAKASTTSAIWVLPPGDPRRRL